MSSSKIALITGANRGLGLEAARQLLQKGVQVVIACRDAAKGLAAQALLQQENLHPAFIQLDISNAAQVQTAYEQLRSQYGRLDILINNAAITTASSVKNTDRMMNTLLDGDINDFKTVFDTNVWGTLQVIQTMIPLLKMSSQGRIINLSSELGSIQLHTDSSSPIYHVKKFGYNSSKTMLNLITIYLQEALRDTCITTYAISPGWVKTEMGTPAAFMEIPDGAKIMVQAALEEVDQKQFFTHALKVIPW